MRTLYLQLLFILAFFSVFACGLAHGAGVFARDSMVNGTVYPCVYRYIQGLNPYTPGRPGEVSGRPFQVQATADGFNITKLYSTATNYTQMVNLITRYYRPGYGWTNSVGSVTCYLVSLDQKNLSDPTLEELYPNGLNGSTACPVPVECPDSDSDGVCDACDSAPGDSTKGGSKYLKGWLERNGETVAFLTSESQENETFDNISWQDAAINAPGVYPAFGVGGGAGYLFDDEEFVAGGGKFVFLDQVEKVSDYNCSQVVNLDQCSGSCEEQIANEDAKEQAEDVPPGQEMAATTEQKMEMHPILAPPDKCDDFYSRCDKSCGGNAAVESRGCVSDETTGKVVAAECQCYHTGSLQYAESWEQLSSVQVEVNVGPTVGGVASGQSVSATVDMSNPGSGTGDDGPGGGPTDGDADGYADGYQMGDRTVNFGPLVQGAGAIGDRFPFSLVTTVRDMANKFDAVGQCPQWELPVFGHTLVVDLCIFDPVAVFVRTLLGVVLGAATFFATMRLMM